MPSIGIATFLYAMITATALLGDIVWKLGFDTPLSWVFHDSIACTALGAYCGYGLSRIKSPRAGYVLHRAIAISIPAVASVCLAAITEWQFLVEFGMFGTLVMHSYQMKVVHVRGYLAPGSWIFR